MTEDWTEREAHMRANMAFVAGQLMGIATREEAQHLKEDLERCAAALGDCTKLDHPVIVELIERFKKKEVS